VSVRDLRFPKKGFQRLHCLMINAFQKRKTAIDGSVSIS
jgi:hypothetical protein